MSFKTSEDYSSMKPLYLTLGDVRTLRTIIAIALISEKIPLNKIQHDRLDNIHKRLADVANRIQSYDEWVKERSK